jgi:hypothetical protein
MPRGMKFPQELRERAHTSLVDTVRTVSRHGYRSSELELTTSCGVHIEMRALRATLTRSNGASS